MESSFSPEDAPTSAKQQTLEKIRRERLEERRDNAPPFAEIGESRKRVRDTLWRRKRRGS